MNEEIELFQETADEENSEEQMAEEGVISNNSVASFVTRQFASAKTKKQADETRFLKAYYNFRGQYSPNVTFTDEEKSKVFVKVTKTKVLAAYGQLVEVLFGGNKFPLSVEPRKLPDDIAGDVHLNLDPNVNGSDEAKGALSSPFGVSGGKALPPGFTHFDLERAGGMKEKLKDVSENLVEGPGTTPTSVTFSPAMYAAKRMEKKIHDQLDEAGASKQLRATAFEMALFGTGIMKGPFAVDKEYPKWGDDGEYTPKFKTIPVTQNVSVWNFYPDPDAVNMEEAEWVVERHKMSRQQVLALKKRPFFREEGIEEALDQGPNYHKEYWETDMEDDNTSSAVNRYEVLEYWGYVPPEVLEEYDVGMSKEASSQDILNVNIWVCNGEVLRVVMNPFNPKRIPYYAVPYEMNPYSFFGIGIAENMDDTQALMNGFMRMSVDNAALSGNLVFEVDENNLVPGQDLKVYPGKVFRRSGGAPGQALFAQKYPNVTQENMMMFDKARLLADESTGFPSYAHGQTNVQSGIGRTASGISMLMNAANGGIRTVIKNVDDYLLGPMGKAFFSFNMQFDFDKQIKGDLEVIAKGTESLMANEVRSQRLMQFLGVVVNPVLAPFAKMDVIVREIAKSLDLDPEKIVNNLSDAALQAEILKKFQQALPEQGQPGAGGPPLPPGANPQDPTGAGGGTIGTGMAPTPGEPGFSANTGEGEQ